MVYKKWYIPFLFLAAFLLRMICVPNPGFEADVSFWKSWGLAPYDHGVVKGLPLTNNNYPTPFAYILWIVMAVYSLFANPHVFNEFWSNTNLLYLTLMKMPTILADLGIAALILFLGKNAKRFSFPPLPFSFYLLTAVLYLFSPLSIFDSAVWGQVDALGVLLFLIAVLFVLKKQPFAAGIIYMVALMTKLQNMIYGPLFFLLIWQTAGLNGLIRAIAGSLVGFFGLNIEFLLAKNMSAVIRSLTANYDYFPYMSLNAYNPWWIVARGNGMQMTDKLLTVGIINAKTLGLILFSSSYLLAVLHQIREKSIDAFFTALVIVVGAFFLFQTESHDRYAFPLAVFLLFWMACRVFEHATIKERLSFWKTKWFQCAIIGYILFTSVYFLNLHTAFIANYPKNGIPWLLFLNAPSWTIPLAVFLTLAFFLFLVTGQLSIINYGLSILFLVLSIFFLNIPLFTRSPISLTRLTPHTYRQDWGTLVKNMPASANVNDWKTWSRLSVQYYFYPQGLGTHANSTIVYHIGKRFRKFTTDYGIDTEAGPQASVIYEIYGDNALLFRSDTVKRFDYPKHTEVNVTGVSELMLVVTDAGNGNVDDHADWLNPVLSP